MKTYTAIFHTDANYAEHEIEAETPEEALAAAREIERGDDSALYYESYDSGQPVNSITIRDDETYSDVAEWLSDELRLRLAARDLLEALEQALVALNTTPSFKVRILGVIDSYAVAAICEAAIAKAKGEA